MSEEITGMFASLDEPEQFLVHDMRFHQTVAAASGNRILTALMNMVATILFEVRSKTVKRARDLKESAEMHRKHLSRDSRSQSRRRTRRDARSPDARPESAGRGRTGVNISDFRLQICQIMTQLSFAQKVVNTTHGRDCVKKRILHTAVWRLFKSFLQKELPAKFRRFARRTMRCST